ncbi:chromosome segregation protein SMC [Halomicroarcula sp. S1AR25-4]|uniref:archaea-specific SMC-related protein n=1 Tax=Haloarcula sp. S1AR25-4 TaxID=2950538 RepID=UPI002874D415|nr:archaea-specific SMC-related protein [Halomicroarcula sp. S1AR25-4]MDS0276737.1 chromosome segregation protein SMC [Halomicroarcula sp. S1AR25-4]
MSTPEEVTNSARFSVENVGGIDEAELDISPGVTILSGKNATNRTSFLQSIMAAMGSRQATLKGDADEGRVTFEYEDEVYERTLKRAGDSVQFSGESYLDDSEVADLFAFLLETNEARQSVARGDDLRDVIMRPVDTEAIKEEIQRLETEKDDINDELATIESRKRDLPDLEQRRNSLREQIADKREELAEKEEEIDESSHDIQESRREQEKLEERLDDLRSTRSDLESLRQKIESRETSIRSLKQERSELSDELADLPETPMGDMEHLESEIERLRGKRQTLNNDISDLQSLIQYNEERLESEDYEVLGTLEDGGDETANGSVTEQLLEGDDETVVCWTCGSSVEREQIEDTVDRLQSLREEKLSDLSEIKSDLEDLKSDKREAEQKQRRREEVERKLNDVEDELEQRTEQIDSLKDQREELTDEVETLESAVEELESEDFEDILDLHREANQLEFDIDRLESDLDDVSEEIAEIEAMVERAEDLREERDELVDELTDKRTKVGQIETEAVEAFNEHMDAVLDILGYENLDRVWIERIERTVREGRRKVDKSAFELHIVRTTENGAAYEDTIDHLSESEREVVGLIFALAGYLVHDLHETVPFMLLDSLEAIDADRIAALVDYFADAADFLVIALLEEDAQALDDDYARVTTI